jgi:hypothetical protein
VSQIVMDPARLDALEVRLRELGYTVQRVNPCFLRAWR